MQFSLYDLQVDHVTHTQPGQENLPILGTPGLYPDSQIDLLYTLLADSLPFLEKIGPDNTLILALGWGSRGKKSLAIATNLLIG